MNDFEILEKCRRELLRAEEIKSELEHLSYMRSYDTTRIVSAPDPWRNADTIADLVSRKESLRSELEELERSQKLTYKKAEKIVWDVLPLKYFKVAMTYYCYGMNAAEVRKVTRCSRVRKYLTDIEKILT